MTWSWCWSCGVVELARHFLQTSVSGLQVVGQLVDCSEHPQHRYQGHCCYPAKQLADTFPTDQLYVERYYLLRVAAAAVAE